MPSKFLFSLLPCVRMVETESSFLKNGSILLEDVIASCDGKSSPIRTYSADELVKATNSFDPSSIISEGSSFKLFRGLLDDRSIIIKKYLHWPSEVEARSMAVRDIIISMQMSTHKNALKLSGCCLEFSVPALVHEDAAKGARHGGLGDTQSLPWKTRLLIATKVAHALAYLHTAFTSPIIHRHLKPTCILLDDDYSPKLSDFSLSITIPPKQFHVEDVVKGTYRYADPTYVATGYITEKTDVYSFGALLLVFLMGQKIGDVDLDKSAAVEDLTSYVDACILGEVRADEQAQRQLQAFLALALLCTKAMHSLGDERESRPCMIDVAKELVLIEKSILCC